MVESSLSEMTSTAQPVSPFDALEASVISGVGIHIEPLPHCQKLSLRGNPSDPLFLKAVKQLCGLALPVNPNSLQTNDESAMLWLGPDEWQWRLAENNTESAEELVDRCRTALQGIASSVVDVSDYYSVIRLRGDRVYDVLAKATPLDVRRALLDTGACAQTRFGHASVLLNRSVGEPSTLSVDLQVRWSFAEYIWLYLTDSVREYQ